MFWLAGVNDRNQPGVPEVIERRFRGWGEQLGDISRAGRFWAQLHGALMLGLPIDATELFAQALAASGGSAGRQSPDNAPPHEPIQDQSQRQGQDQHQDQDQDAVPQPMRVVEDMTLL